MGRKSVKPDPGLWLPLLAQYALTTLSHDTVLEGTLRDGLTPESTEVQDALAAWPASAYLDHEEAVTHVVLVYHSEAVRDERGRGPWLHIGLLLATLATTAGAGALMEGRDAFATRVFEVGAFSVPYPSGVDFGALWMGMPFALPFLGVLLAHEMGHYLAARRHRVRATLPYFIPFPPYFSLIGTVGAFIRLRGPTVRRAVLFDIGAAGPLASLCVSLPMLAYGLTLSRIVPGPATLTTPFLIRFAGERVWLGNGPTTHVLGALFGPGPVGAAPILLHPLALAGWLGLFVTALNLLPLGQLDGGHVLYALAPSRQKWAARAFLAALVPLGFLWWGWWGWAAVVLVLHRGRLGHPTVIQPQYELGPIRRRLALSLILIFFLTFVVVPLHL